MKNKFSNYGFWTALAGAVVVLLQALGSAFGFTVQEKIVSDIIMAVAGILVVFGVVVMPSNNQTDNPPETKQTEDAEDDKKEDN